MDENGHIYATHDEVSYADVKRLKEAQYKASTKGLRDLADRREGALRAYMADEGRTTLDATAVFDRGGWTVRDLADPERPTHLHDKDGTWLGRYVGNGRYVPTAEVRMDAARARGRAARADLAERSSESTHQEASNDRP